MATLAQDDGAVVQKVVTSERPSHVSLAHVIDVRTTTVDRPAGVTPRLREATLHQGVNE